MYLPSAYHVAQGRGEIVHFFYEYVMERQLQTPQGQLFNNFVSGSVGGFVGTALNTPFDVRLRAQVGCSRR